MIINNQPDSTKLQAAFEPLVFVVSETAFDTHTISSALEVRLMIDGIEKELLYYDSINTDIVGSNLECKFKIDISEAVQKWLPNTEQLFLFAYLASNYVASFMKGTVTTQIKAVSYLPNLNGLLVRVPLSETHSNSFECIGAYLKETQTSNYSLPYTSDIPRKFLSNKPLVTTIAQDEKEFLYYFISSVSCNIYIEVFDATGASMFDFEHIAVSSNKILCVNVGLSSVASIVPGLTALDNIQYYDVRLVNSMGQNLTETRRYNIENHRCNGYRLHFLNQFGFYDSVFLQTDYKENMQVKSDYFEKIRDRNQTYSRSQTRISAYSQKTYDAQITNLSDAHVEWLQELLISPSVFWEKNGDLVPINIEDGNFILKQTSEMNELKISFSLSNKTFSQRG